MSQNEHLETLSVYKMQKDFSESVNPIRLTYIQNINIMRKADFQLKEKFLSVLRNSFISDVYKAAFSFSQKTSQAQLSSCEELSVEFPDSAAKIYKIMKAVHQMDHSLKTAYSMFLGGYNYDEIAEKLNISTDAVNERIHSARQELQNILQLRDCQKN